MEEVGKFNFDTHQFVKDLKKAGFKENQAEVIVRMLSKSREYDVAHLVTKEQLKDLERLIYEKSDKNFKCIEKVMEEKYQDLAKELTAQKQSIDACATKAQLASLHADLIKWAIGAMVGIIGTTLALIQWLT
jgi:hypothetical protein